MSGRDMSIHSTELHHATVTSRLLLPVNYSARLPDVDSSAAQQPSGKQHGNRIHQFFGIYCLVCV